MMNGEARGQLMRKVIATVFALGSLWSVPSLAQNLDGRVGKLESEMRAVQRKVFPGGGAMIEPQIAPTQAPPREMGSPASSAIDDLTQRVSSLEGQMAAMTGQIEQSQNRLRVLEDAFAAYRTATDARLGAGAAAAVAPAPAAAPEVRSVAQAPVVQDPERGAQVAAVPRPSTGDAPEDEYLYGYRLWAAKLYPEAAVQLEKVVKDYPKHRRASYAQNLLGRTLLDDGKPSRASIAFYDNYKKMPEGERAPDSLFYLGQTLVKLNKPADACKVYGELTDVYGGKIAGSMKADIARARTAAKCT